LVSVLALTWPFGTRVGAADVAVWCCIGVVVCAGADVAVWCGVGVIVGIGNVVGNVVCALWYGVVSPLPYGCWCVGVGGLQSKLSVD